MLKEKDMAEFLNGLFGALPGAVVQGLIWGIMAIGVYITFRVLDIADLTVDGTLSTGAGVVVLAMMFGCNVWVSMAIAFIVGCVAGWITGIFHTKFGIPAILAGILTQIALYSINLRINGIAKGMQTKAISTESTIGEIFKTPGSSNAALNRYKYELLFSQSKEEVKASIILAIIFVVAIIAILYWFFGTELGHGLRATGTNEAMARANGINTNRNKVIGLILSNGIVALSGAMLAQLQGSVDVSTGKGAIVIGLAAVIIGEVLFGKFFKNFALKLLAVALGGVVYYVVITVVLRLGFDPNDLKLFTAIVVALFLGVPYWRAKIAEKTVKNKKKGAKA